MWSFLIHHLKSKKKKVKTMNFQKVIYQGALTTKPIEDREFQFVYTCSILRNAQFINRSYLTDSYIDFTLKLKMVSVFT